jgi:hypothetical protein
VPAFPGLSTPEHDILDLIAAGRSNSAIAGQLALSGKRYATTCRTFWPNCKSPTDPRPSSALVTPGSAPPVRPHSRMTCKDRGSRSAQRLCSLSASASCHNRSLSRSVANSVDIGWMVDTIYTSGTGRLGTGLKPTLHRHMQQGCMQRVAGLAAVSGTAFPPGLDAYHHLTPTTQAWTDASDPTLTT